MNGPTLLVAAIVAAVLVGIVYKLIQDKRQGKGCSGCSGCSQSDSCHSVQNH